MKIITEDQAAALLACSRSRLKRLRLSGRLPYFPGRPPLFDQADIYTLIADRARRAAERAARDAAPPVPVPPIDPAALARKKWERRMLRARVAALMRR